MSNHDDKQLELQYIGTDSYGNARFDNWNIYHGNALVHTNISTRKIPPVIMEQLVENKTVCLVSYETVNKPDLLSIHLRVMGAKIIRISRDGLFNHVVEANAKVEAEREEEDYLIINALTKQEIESVIVKTQFTVVPGTTFTICILTLRNGFMVTGESACVDKTAFVEATGEKYSKEDAIEKIWQLEGYLLKQRLYEDRQ